MIDWNYTKENPLRVATLCSGYESQCMAIRNIGIPFDLVMWAEFDPESNAPLEKQPAVIAHNAVFPEYKDRNWGDMTKIDWEKAPDFDCLFYSTPCFVAGTLVQTTDGLKPIEDVREDDMVLTHRNRYKKVLSVGKKPSREILKVRGAMLDELFCTPNHPFYTRQVFRHGHKRIRDFKEPIWKAASDLTRDDYLGFAINGNSSLPEWEGVSLHHGTHWDICNKIAEQLDDPNFWYIMGRYVGDGWQRNDKTHKGILIAFCEKDKASLFNALDRLGWNYTISDERTCGRVTIYGKELCEFVSRYGKYAYGKRIDQETLDLPIDLLESFLNGYIDSDGCFADSEYRITTVSRELAYGVMEIVAKCYKRPSRIYKSNRPEKYIIEGREVNQRNTYAVLWHKDARKQDKAVYKDGTIWFPLRAVSKTCRKEFVYNLEVEEDHSYTANGAIVHNCQSISNAGLQHGFVEGSGTRSSIIWNVRDAIKIKRPKIAILENVKAMISGKFVGMFNLWQSELVKFGYTNFAQVLNAKDYGVPQNRERIFLVSILGDAWYNFPQPQELKLRLKDLLEEKVEEKYYLDDCKVAEFVGGLNKEKKSLICKD